MQVARITRDQINTLLVVRGPSRSYRLHRGISSANIVIHLTQQNPVRHMVNNVIDVRAGINLRYYMNTARTATVDRQVRMLKN